MIHRILNLSFISLLVVGCGGCGGGTSTSASTSTGGTGTGSATTAAPAGSAYMGLYRGDWGTMILRQVGDEVWGSYAHDRGAVRGRLTGDVFTGRWCEDPSRTDDSDSGQVRFVFTVGADGVTSIDGAWSYGSAEPDHDDWDVTLRPGERDEELEATFADPSHFCP